MPETAKTTYQVQPGYSIKGVSSWGLLELDPGDSLTQDLVSEGQISESVNYAKVAPSSPDAYRIFRRNLKGSPQFFRVLQAAQIDQPVSALFSLFMETLGTEDHEDFLFALESLVGAMDTAGDAFPNEELEGINNWLTVSGFLYQLDIN